MNFVPSITEPPPTASRKSTFSARTISTAFEAGFVARVRLDAAELDHGRPRRARTDLVVDAVAPDRAAAVGQQDFGVGGDEFRQFGDGALAEDDLAGLW